MKQPICRQLRLIITTILTLTLIALKPCHVYSDANDDALASLYNKMNTVFFGNKTLYTDNSRRTIVWIYPGLPIAPSKENNANTALSDELLNLSKILNPAPSIAAIYQERSLSLPDIYRYVLDNSQVSEGDFSTTARKRLDEAYAILADTTKVDGMSDKYTKFLDYKSRYANAMDILSMAQLDEKQRGIPCPPKLIDNVKKIESMWRTQGFKNVVELAIKTILSIAQGDLVTWKTARDRFNSMVISSSLGDLPLTLTYPQYDHWADRDNWTVFTWEQKLDMRRPAGTQVSTGVQLPRRSPVLSLNSDAKAGIGQLVGRSSGISTSLNCTAAAAKALTDQQFSEFKNMKITARLKRIDIMRPWLDESIFTSRRWRFNSGGNEVLSAGPDALRRPIDEMLPLLAESIIISDGLEITAEVTAKEINTIAETKNLIKDAPPGASIGIGPFAIAGRQAWGEGSLTQNVTINGKVMRPGGLTRSFGSISSEYKGTNTIKVTTNGLQIIGYICRYLPKAPNPDPKAVF